jgi:YidC/Oxa1 family membrane protein insertase
MKKFLDILMVVLLILLVINLFSDKPELKPDNSLTFEFSDNSYNIPASVILNIKNNTSTGLVLNTCDDININYLWENIKFDQSFCKDITINSLSWNTIDYSSVYKDFEKTWKYTLNVKVDWKEYIEQFELENSGTIKKLFIWLFYAPIYNLMIFLLNIFNWVFGWAIITITFIIRTALLWPQHKMMVSQKKLQAIQPKIKEIQEKYKGQQQVLWMKLMELYKKEKVNPMWSCGFLIIQMPILLVIYHIILSIKDPSNFFYTYSFLSWFHLDSIDYNFFWLDLLWSWGISGAILAFTVAIIQFFQIKLSLAWKQKDQKWVVLEKKKWSEWYSQFMPDPEVMNKFMLFWMPLMVWVFTYTLFAWIGIYWWISTLFMLVQQFIVNKKLEK